MVFIFKNLNLNIFIIIIITEMKDKDLVIFYIEKCINFLSTTQRHKKTTH